MTAGGWSATKGPGAWRRGLSPVVEILGAAGPAVPYPRGSEDAEDTGAQMSAPGANGQNQWQQGPPGRAPQNGVPGPSPRRPPWTMIFIACGCIAVMVLAGGVGVGLFALIRGTGDGESTASPAPESSSTTEADPSETDSAPQEAPTEEGADGEGTDEEGTEFEVIEPWDRPSIGPEETLAVLEDNPLAAGPLPRVGTCDLPETPADHDVEQLQTLLDSAIGCLNSLWSTANSDRNLSAESTEIVAYEHPDLPANPCSEENFSADAPTVCNLDATIYWPLGVGFGTEQSDLDQVAATYLVDLGRVYGARVMWGSSVVTYYAHLREITEDDDPDLYDESLRRYSLQMDCWGAAASMQMPATAQPSAETRETLSDPDTWSERPSSGEITPESRGRWMEAGFGSGGDLSACNTWAAPADQVA